jgi:hypothetical protein
MIDGDDVLASSGTDLFNHESSVVGRDSSGRSQLHIVGDSGAINVAGSGWVVVGTTAFTDLNGLLSMVMNMSSIKRTTENAQLFFDTDIGRLDAVL